MFSEIRRPGNREGEKPPCSAYALMSWRIT